MYRFIDVLLSDEGFACGTLLSANAVRIDIGSCDRAGLIGREGFGCMVMGLRLYEREDQQRRMLLWESQLTTDNP